MNQIRDKLKDMRSESIAFESSITSLQNELSIIESDNRENILIRERLITENKAIKKNIENFKQRELEMIEILNSYDNQLKIKEDEFSKLSKDKALLDKEFRCRELEKLLNDFKNGILINNKIIELIEKLFSL